MSTVVSLVRHPTLRLSPADDVVIAARPIAAGTFVDAEGVRCSDAIPAGHKLAVRAIAKGQPVRRYDQIICFATQDIAAGQHVHTHNLAFETFERDYAVGVDAKPTPAVAEPATFMGIVRPDGRVATRNYIGVVSTVNCSASVSKFVAQHFTRERLAAFPNVDGVVPITHSSGCGMASAGAGIDLLRRTIAGYCRHPNFAGVVIVGLGCEANQMDALFQAQQMQEGALLKPLVMQTVGGTRKTVEAAIAAVESMLAEYGSAMIERFVQGRELTVGILGNKALPIIEVIPGRDFYDYTAKYADGAGTRYSFDHGLGSRVRQEVLDLSIAAHECIGCRDMSRVDFILDEHERPWLLEINTIPGFTSHSLLPMAAKQEGLDFAAMVSRIVKLAMQRQGVRQAIQR